MNVNLLTKELKKDFKVFIIVTLALTAFLCITLMMYSAMKESMLAVTDLYAKMSPAIQDALNFHDGQWNHILGFYATYFVYYVPMMGGAYAIYLGANILSREEQNKTAEFLMAKPLSRSEIVTTKLAVMISYIFGFNLVLWLNGVLWTGFISGFDETFAQITSVHIYGLFICQFFGFLGFLVTVLMKRAKAIIGPLIGLVMGLYMFDMILRITDKAQFLLYLTPYKYMDIDLLSADYHLEIWRLAVLAGAMILLAVVSYSFYRKKDILI